MKLPALTRDVPVLLPMAALIGLGWVMVFSTAAVIGVATEHSGVFAHLRRQVIATGLGAVAMWAVLRIPLPVLAARAPVLLAGTVVLMFLVFVPGLGKSVARATRWIDLRVVSFQPVEVFKLAVVLMYARLLSAERPGAAWSWASWGRLAALGGLALALPLIQRDYGSALLLMGLGGTLLWIAGARAGALAGFAGVALVAAVGGLLAAPYRMHRVQQWIESWGRGDGGYQTRQSLIALGSGGITGVGLGESVQKLLYLPSAHADFIFSIIGEELGIIGAGATVVLFVFLLREGFAIAAGAPGRFERLLACGAASLLFLQAMWHVAVAMVLVPTKGLALPFVSYGGSSLIASMLAVGLLLRCAAAADDRARPAAWRTWAPS